MTTDAQVIIVGAGPAGSMAAYQLASKGISVLILEKAIFPRYKVCGAGLTHKILQQIPFDISPILETHVTTIIFSRGFKDTFQRQSVEPLLYCTNRDKLDDFLLQKAVQAGARVLHGEQVMKVSQNTDNVTVTTKDNTYRSNLLIGAEGAAGHVARLAGLHENIEQGLAWEAEITADPETVKTFSNTVFLDWGSFPGGYGWVFPKGDHFSIGVGGPASLSKWMMPYYKKMLAYLASERSKIEVLETMSLKSWPIPVRIKKGRFHNGRILVAGDAAGLTDPLTGEGIYYAVRSGILAGDISAHYMQGIVKTLDSYSAAVNGELMEELLEANRIKHVFNTVPARIHHFVRDSDRAWKAFNKILRGERLYVDVRNGFSRWKLFWGAICKFSYWMSEEKERVFRKRGFK